MTFLLALIGLLALTSMAPAARDRWALEDRVELADVAGVTPSEVVAYLRQNPEAPFDFSPSDILETMDTTVLDRSSDPGTVHRVIAQTALDTLEELYPTGHIVLAVEAGHGGKPWDPGSEGTEAEHTRAVVAEIERLASERVTVRRIYNDEILDDIGLPPALTKRVVSTMLIRQVRAAMLAEVAAAQPAEVHVHELSIHFNAGSGGAMVLHQGETVHPDRRALSVEYATRYLDLVIPRLNATGVLPVRLRRWGGTGLHDDVMMYRPDYFTAEDTRGITLRYSALQGRGYMARYVETVVASAR